MVKQELTDKEKRKLIASAEKKAKSFKEWKRARTDPEAERFFMTVNEAVQLVLQAGVLGKGGEIFVLNMGQPIKILDLAKHLWKFYWVVKQRFVHKWLYN